MKPIDLQGLCVLNTRPLKEAQALNQRIVEAGGQAFSCPALEIVPLHNWWPLLPNLQKVDQAIFISANAVREAFRLLKEKNLDWPPKVCVSAIGEATAKALYQEGITEVALPSQSSSELFLQEGFLQVIANQTILLFKGEGGRTLIAEALKSRGANLIALEVYRRTCPKVPEKALQHWQQNASIDVVLFTSAEAIVNMFHMIGENRGPWLRNLPALVISERIRDIAAARGINNISVCEHHSIIEGLSQFKKRTSHEQD